MTAYEIELKVKELKELQRLIEEAEAEAETIKDTIKKEMGDSELMTAGVFKITYKSVTSSRIDTTALKKAMPEVAEAFSKPSTTRRLCIA